MPPHDSNPVAFAPRIELQDASVVFGKGIGGEPRCHPRHCGMERGDFLALRRAIGLRQIHHPRLASNRSQPSTANVAAGRARGRRQGLRDRYGVQNPTMLPWLTIEKNVMLARLRSSSPFSGATFPAVTAKGAYR